MSSALKDTGCKPQAHGGAAPGGGPCPRCARPRCTAAAKTRPGERCRKNPHPGATICTNHGLTAAGRAAAERNQLEAEAGKVLEGLWPGMAGVDPVKDPVGNMERLAGALTVMLERTGAKVNDLDHLAAGAGLTQLRGELVLLDKVAGHLRQLLEAMARLGIAERHVQLEQERARLIFAAFMGTVEALGLVPADRTLAIETFHDRLGDLFPAEVVAGEVAS